jgi:GMP synthase (glutamine-hydrolysing)
MSNIYLIIDNTKNLDKALATPYLLDYLKSKNIECIVVSENEELRKVLRKYKYKGAILSGGPICLSEKTYLSYYSKNFAALIELECPILGICFGFQVMCMAYGGFLTYMNKEVKGINPIQINPNTRLFKNLSKQIKVYQSHNDCVVEPPLDFKVTSLNCEGIIQAVENYEKKRYGVQFHPEVSGDIGKKIINNFINICN